MIIMTNCEQMTEQEAKEIILQDPGGNIFRRIKAIQYAQSVLGEDATMGDIYRWAEEKESAPDG